MPSAFTRKPTVALFGMAPNRSQVPAVLALIGANLLACSTAVADDSAVPPAIMKALRDSVARMPTRFTPLRMEWEAERPAAAKPDGELTRTRTVYATTDGFEKLQRIFAGPKYFETIVLRGGDLSYSLRKTEKDGDYFVSDAPLPESLIKDLETQKQLLVYAPYHMGLVNLPRMLQSPNFHVSKFQQLQDGCCKFEYTDFKLTPDGRRVEYSGWFSVDPKLEYALKEYEHEYKTTTKGKPGSKFEHRRLSYANDEGRPQLKSMQADDHYSNGRGDKYTVKILSLSFDRVPKSEFSLDTYGLADAALGL